MLKIIINADDFGINQKVDYEIINLLTEKKISSTTIIANVASVETLNYAAKNCDKYAFGIHLNLDEFHPLIVNEVFYKHGIVDINGAFIKGGVYNIINFSSELKDAIYEEFDAQIKKLIDFNIHISHIDSHHHIHSVPEVFQIIERLMNIYNIKHIRGFRRINILKVFYNKFKRNKIINTSVPISKNSIPLIRRIINYFGSLYCGMKIKRNYYSTDNFYSFIEFYSLILNNYNKNNDLTIELMCHPGHPLYEKETQLVQKCELLNLIKYKLIGFHEVNNV